MEYKMSIRSFTQFLCETTYGVQCNVCKKNIPDSFRDNREAKEIQKTALCNRCDEKGYWYDANNKLHTPDVPSGYRKIGNAAVNMLDPVGAPGLKTYVQDLDVYRHDDKYYAQLKGFAQYLGMDWLQVKPVPRYSDKAMRYSYQAVKNTFRTNLSIKNKLGFVR
jgi:hypothetical protein